MNVALPRLRIQRATWPRPGLILTDTPRPVCPDCKGEGGFEEDYGDHDTGEYAGTNWYPCTCWNENRRWLLLPLPRRSLWGRRTAPARDPWASNEPPLLTRTERNPMHTIPSPRELADKAAEAVRDLNHASWNSKGELTYPGDAYEVVASLKVLAQRLPQCFEQLARFLGDMAESGAVTADYGEPDEHLADARSALASGVLVAQTLAEFLDHAHSSLAPLGYDTGS